MKARTKLGRVAIVGAGLLLASCGGSTKVMTRADLPRAQKATAVVFVDHARPTKLGPPPFQYWRILGHPVPNWDAEPRAGAGGYVDRDSPFNWTFLGPRPISSDFWSYENRAGGRVVSVAPHPTDGNVVSG